MEWQQFTLTTTKDKADELSEKLTAAGAVAITLADDEQQPLYQISTEEMPVWDKIELIALFEHNFVQSSLDSELAALGTWQTIAEQDWLHKWKEDLTPMLFGKKLWVCPSWCEIPDPNAVHVIIDPEMAFGIGSHPTTALCLEWLALNLKPNDIVVDYGCGSGILGIAAAKLNAAKVHAVDIDRTALEVSINNAHKNQIRAEQFVTYLPEQLPNLQADVVIANILATPLVELSDKIAGLVKPNGYLVLSGILREQAENIKTVYGRWFRDFEITPQEEWVRITARAGTEPNIY